jgi:peptidyl-prolyl cis-trans isomerase B (cyclophilin B)
LAAAVASAATKQPTATGNHVTLETNKGKIVLELYPAKAPKTVANFLAYVRSGHYDGTIFHRVIASFMIQGGNLDANGKPRPTSASVVNEADNGLTNDKYTVAMARTPVCDSATDQFFINVANNSFLNFKSKDPSGCGYTVFAKVISGQDVVDAIAAVPVKPGTLSEAVPVQSIVLTKVSAN